MTSGQRWSNPPVLTGCRSRHRGTWNPSFAIRSWHDRLYCRTELTHINDTKRGTTHVIGKIRNAHRCGRSTRSEEHTSELQSRFDLVCRLLLEKKKKKIKTA